MTADQTQRGTADITGRPGEQLTVANRDGYVQGAPGSTMLQAYGAGQAAAGAAVAGPASRANGCRRPALSTAIEARFFRGRIVL